MNFELLKILQVTPTIIYLTLFNRERREPRYVTITSNSILASADVKGFVLREEEHFAVRRAVDAIGGDGYSFSKDKFASPTITIAANGTNRIKIDNEWYRELPPKYHTAVSSTIPDPINPEIGNDIMRSLCCTIDVAMSELYVQCVNEVNHQNQRLIKLKAVKL
jgi:hypothetical protein